MSTEHYDVIIIGSGAGGGTLAYRLAPSGLRILILERGALGGHDPTGPQRAVDSLRRHGANRFVLFAEVFLALASISENQNCLGQKMSMYFFEQRLRVCIVDPTSDYDLARLTQTEVNRH